jgi:hypothetical protein
MEWSPADAQYIRTVFGQPTGQKFIAIMKAYIPKVTSEDHEKIVSQALKKQGAEDLFEHMIGLTGDVQPDFKEGRDFVDLTGEGD